MQAIQTKFLGPTNTKPARIKAFTESGKSVVLSYEYGCGAEQNADRAVMTLCKRMGWSGTLHCGSTASGYVYTFEQFNALVV